MDTLQIIREDPDRRGEYYKEFVLNGGLRMAAVYADAVHYQKDGQWEPIDNTLKLSGGAYVNTAGVWQVSLPQQFSSGSPVTITKDGYTLSFHLAGALRSGYLQTAALSAGETVQLQTAQSATAQIREVNGKVELEHPEILPETNHSRLEYENVYANTNIIYDLNANQIKESIVMEAYSSDLRGYRYTLNTGELNPVLTDSGEIHLYDRNREQIVMVMPAPFLVDDAGICCYDVNVALTGSGGSYTLTYLLPQSWLADSERQWPVVLDPVMQADTTRSNIRDVSVYEQGTPEDYNSGILDVGHCSAYGVMRAYLKYDVLPPLSSADVVVKAQLSLLKPTTQNTAYPVEAHKVLGTWESETLTYDTQPGINSLVEDYAIATTMGIYHWDITDIVRDWYESENTGVVLKAPGWVENTTSDASYRRQFYSSDYSADTRPILTVVFRNNNGLEDYWDYTASSAGRAGTGYVNNYTGNLVWVHPDIGFGGNRMPVSISHIYNTNDAGVNTYGLGNGWRTNFNQTLTVWEQNSDYYVWTDSDGTHHYFYETENGSYQDEDGMELTLTVGGSGNKTYTITDKYGNETHFDGEGRLSRIENNQPTESAITVAYTQSGSKKISQVTDGVGRKYLFTYLSSGLLSKIEYTGTGSTVLATVTFGYTGTKLTTVTDQDSKSVTYSYGTGNLLTSVTDIDGYQLRYSYTAYAAGVPNRVSAIREFDGTVEGGSLTIAYGHNYTTFTDHNGNQNVSQFNNWGNTVSIQDGEGRAQFGSYASNDPEDTTQKGNQLTLSSKLQNTVGNMLDDSSFEGDTLWGTVNGASQSITTAQSYIGAKSLTFTNAITNYYSGVSSDPFTAKPGETYTFSAYVKTGTSGGGYLSLGSASDTSVSETLSENQDWTRLEVAYTNNTSADVSINAKVISAASGPVYIDCVQLEKAETASRYNLVENGDFRYDLAGWTRSGDSNSDELAVSVSNTAAPELNDRALLMNGNPTHALRVEQTVAVSGVKGDCFVLAGWTGSNAVPLTEENRTFGIRGTFLYTDNTTESFTFSFNPDARGLENWQYVSGAMVAKGAYSGIKVEILYEYNANNVLFDGIQLFKEQFGSSYTYDEEGNVTSVTDLQGQITDYGYDDINNTDLLRIIQDNKAKVTYTYDPYHNVETATTQEGVTYEFEYDVYGNNTAVSIKFGEIAITSTADYTDDGNRLDYTTDALGNETHYSYHPDTNLLQWVKAPEDTEASRTEYTYDTMYRLASVTAKVDGNATKTLSALYGYTDDLLTSIETESTTYTFAYGDFALRSSIQIGERTLAEYSYTDKNHYLQRVDYGNGDMVEYSYDNNGNLIAQLYEDGDTVTYKYDNSGELASVTDSASGLTTKYYYDLTGRLMKYTETGTDFSHSAAYTYDKLNNLTGLQETIDGVTRTISYFYDDDNRVIGTNAAPGYRGFTYDDLGRLTNRTTKHNGTNLITERFSFNISGTKATKQVSSHSFVYGSTRVGYGYIYDDNGNITSVLRNGATIIQYVYDSQNQLVRENHRTLGKTWTWSYDDAGNILTRTEYNYTTGELGTAIDVVSYAYTDSVWSDLLTAYDGSAITYDAIGNPLTDGRWTYTWEHGRELASMAENTAVVITTQPEDCFCAVGQSCSFTVAAQGERLTYRWQYSADGGTTWIDSVDATAVTSTMTIDVAEASQIGLLWRCIVTDKDGRTAISQSGTVVDSTATRSITITNQPDDFYCATGDTTAFAVEAAGEGLTYHWQYSSDGSEWSNIYSETAFTPTYSWNGVHPSQFGTYYRCQITDADGNVTYSRGARLKTTTSLWEYTYNADGLRTKRTNGDRTYEYTYLGSQLTRMTVDGHDLYFTYDAAGTPLTVSCDGTLYYYITNIQGDVIAIIDTAGTQVTSYIYDAWGNILSTTGTQATAIGRYNPLRYRGYIYDTETGLYYLQSRYYNPKVGRFINADGYVATGQGFTGNNMFAYCLNNPVNFVDRNGENPEPLAAWLSGMWWLCGVDGVLPIGEVVYVGAAVIIGVATIGIVDDAFAVGEELSNHLMQYAEHTSGARKSTKNKHEKGKKRKQNDQGGEGGDQRRINYRKNKRKASYYPKRKARRGVNNAPLLTIPNASGGIRMIGIGQGFRP